MEPYKESMSFEMIQEVSSKPIEGREMCHIVTEAERRKGREMVRLVSDTERRKGHEMVRLIEEA